MTVDDGSPDMGRRGLFEFVERAHHELIVVTDGLIPRDRLIEPDGLERSLIIDAVGPDMGAGTGGDDLAVEDIDVPLELIVLGVVDGVAQGDAEIKWLFLCNALIVWTAASRTWGVERMMGE